jgi:DNA-binding CsgD family transcriptional regulator
MIPKLRSPFSPRERQIAELIGDNRSYNQIAAELTTASCPLSPHTVRSYVVRMARKIDFGNRNPEPRAAVYALVLYERFVAGRMVG